jgi:hypothetical protein
MEVHMTYSGGETFTPTSMSQTQRTQLRSVIEERRRSLGSESLETEEIVIRKDAIFAPDAEWTCASLQLVADSLYTDAALAPDRLHFQIYSTLGDWYQDAHDAQCGTSPF